MAKSRSPLIITFIGPVGVGKSTQMRLTRKYLESQKRKTVVTYIRSTHGLAFLLSALIKTLRKVTNRVNATETQFTQILDPLWVYSDTLSILVKFFFAVYIPYRLGYSIVIEEGLNMTLEHYRLFRPRILGVKPRQLPLIELLLRWINSRKHVEILIGADELEIRRRRKTRSFRRVESEQFVGLQRKAIKNLRGPTMMRIDTTHQSIESVHETIIHVIDNLESLSE